MTTVVWKVNMIRYFSLAGCELEGRSQLRQYHNSLGKQFYLLCSILAYRVCALLPIRIVIYICSKLVLIIF